MRSAGGWSRGGRPVSCPTRSLSATGVSMSACRAGRRRTRAPGILFRNVIRRASIKEDAIACGTGQQDARSRAGCFRTARRRVVLLSAQIAAEGRLGAMSTEPQRTCPSCGNEFSGAMEFCPVCMLRMGLAGGIDSDESSASEDTVKPTTSEHAAQWASLTKPSTSICNTP